MKNSKKCTNYNCIFVLLLVIFVIGCKKPSEQNIKISINEYNQLIYTKEQCEQLSKNYTILEMQLNQSEKQLQNVSNILFNVLAYEKPIEIYNPIKVFKKHIITYPAATNVAKTSIWLFIAEFILALGFFIADKSRRWWWIVTIIILIFLIGFLLFMIGSTP